MKYVMKAVPRKPHKPHKPRKQQVVAPLSAAEKAAAAALLDPYIQDQAITKVLIDILSVAYAKAPGTLNGNTRGKCGNCNIAEYDGRAPITAPKTGERILTCLLCNQTKSVPGILWSMID